MAQVKTYEVLIPAGMDHEDGLVEAKEKASGVGITLDGDTDKGTFSGTAAGTYRREGDRLHFQITKKPFFISWGMIESQLRKVFDDVIVH
ncbi:MAG: hypothetical protein QNJ90_03940 [Planctomycetota bacterium]|nr:hypothetical protein [Planctomycetota bacterium]